MIQSLRCEGVGPAKEFGPIEFSPRLNIFTGDNGLGKSFILELLWLIISNTWTHKKPLSARRDSCQGFIHTKYSIENGQITEDIISVPSYGLDTKRRDNIHFKNTIGIYINPDGGASVWDGFKHDPYRSTSSYYSSEAFNFTQEDIFLGIIDGKSGKLCNGLINDWVLWQKSNDPAFNALKEALAILSPPDINKLNIGEPVRLGYESTNYPSLASPDGIDIPIIHASSGARRIASLAYLIIWAWYEHLNIFSHLEVAPVKQFFC